MRNPEYLQIAFLIVLGIAIVNIVEGSLDPRFLAFVFVWTVGFLVTADSMLEFVFKLFGRGRDND